jgi:hypothetical protein
MDYTKNISQSIFTPAVGQKDFKYTISEDVLRRDRRTKSASRVHMHEYRGSTNLYIGYDPSPPVKIRDPRLSVIKQIKEDLNYESERK